MLDESLLDSPDALARADGQGLLRGAAEAGARVRVALRQAVEAGLTELRPEGRPRAVFVAGHGPATACTADMLGALADGSLPVTLLRPTGRTATPDALRWTLPGWAGPVDLLLLTTTDGTEPGLTALVEQAYRRGCTVVAVCPPAAQLAEMVGGTHGLTVPLAADPRFADLRAPDVAPAAAPGTDPDPDRGLAGPAGDDAPADVPGTLWALLTPLLVLADRLGLFAAPQPALHTLADRLDAVAARCGPAVDTYDNPAKTLATEISGTLPLLWSDGAVAGAAARHWAASLTALSGTPALAAQLPEATAAHGALLAGPLTPGGADLDDFFRDRVEEPEPLRPRVVLLRDQPPPGEAGHPAHSPVPAARDLAYDRDTPLSVLEPADGAGPLEAAAELIATADFASLYLRLAAG